MVMALVTAALQIASYILLQPPPDTKVLAMTEQPPEVVIVGSRPRNLARRPATTRAAAACSETRAEASGFVFAAAASGF
ncbi:hypothetical protein PVAP13_9KG458242 [Panicum virgatum]|uniref:Secreted protein n=1 Tax=Panicum virgatum TaxID=38727 RepID=A0A8T0NFG9_PANVG|nr:hypothetical protein PVAP13_9KG458242 [Panicum virgatum]